VFSNAILNKELDLTSLIAIAAFHVLAIGAIFTFSWAGLITFLIMSLLTGCLGITLGFHRLLTHGSFKTPRVLKHILAFFGCLALQGGPVRWVATHRLHHKQADTPQDPHSSKEGFWWSHLFWNFYRQAELKTIETIKRLAPEVYKDPVLRWMDKHFFLLYLAFALSLFLAGTLIKDWELGLSLLVWGAILRVVYVWHITWFVNSATHYWGYKSYASSDDSRNNWWVALLTFGEGWHNNHHVRPQSARMGLRWFEIDVTYGVICILRHLRLANGILLPAFPVKGS